MGELRRNIFIKLLLLLLIFPVCMSPVYAHNGEIKQEQSGNFFFRDYRFNPDYASSSYEKLSLKPIFLHDKDIAYQSPSPFLKSLPPLFKNGIFCFFSNPDTQHPFLDLICVLII
jgi:hypothetical protein